MRIYPDNDKLLYCGRIDFSDARRPEFVFAGSFVKIRFKGTCISALIENRRSYFDNYLGIIIDGTMSKILLSPDSEEKSYVLAENLSEDVHELMLYKRMDACHSIVFLGFEVETGAELFTLDPLPARKIEVFGDSISCGEVSEALDYVGQSDPENQGEYSNSFYSYSWLTARKLNAQIHITSQGGAALKDKTGWFHWPDFIGLESIYDKIQYNPEIGPVTEWNFEDWTPQVVIFAFGQNDANPEDYMANDYDGEKAAAWKKEYAAFIGKMLNIYPDAHIICTTTILGHNANWDKAIAEVVDSLNNKQVHHFLYEKNGCGTSGHVRIPEAEKMSDELSNYIQTLDINW